MMEATKGFRRLKAHKQLPTHRAARAAHLAKHTTRNKLEDNLQAAKHHQPATLIPPSSTKRGTSPIRLLRPGSVLRTFSTASTQIGRPAGRLTISFGRDFGGTSNGAINKIKGFHHSLAFDLY